MSRQKLRKFSAFAPDRGCKEKNETISRSVIVRRPATLLKVIIVGLLSKVERVTAIVLNYIVMNQITIGFFYRINNREPNFSRRLEEKEVFRGKFNELLKTSKEEYIDLSLIWIYFQEKERSTKELLESKGNRFVSATLEIINNTPIGKRAKNKPIGS